MRYLVVGALFLGLAGGLFAQGQQQVWSLGGYGSILHPGIGHVPQTPPGGVTGPYFRRGNFGGPFLTNHPQHQRTTIVPYPIYYGGFGYGGYGYDPSLGYPPPYGEPPAANGNAVPTVVINQNFVPPQANPLVQNYPTPDTSQDQQQQSGLKLYQTPPTHPYADAGQGQSAAPARRTVMDEQPTLYLIAFKDHTIVQALGYWMEGSTLHYVSAEHTLNQASMDLIDRELSQRLNDERGIEFKLPPAR